jgi:hypothetical protein
MTFLVKDVDVKNMFRKICRRQNDILQKTSTPKTAFLSADVET